MTPEEIAERYAFARPGYVLVDHGLVGLPYWRMRIRLLVQESKPFGPLHEYVLRANEAGIQDTGNIAALLGLDATLVLETSADLVSSGLLKLVGEDSSSLTGAGRQALAELRHTRIEEAEVAVYYDGLLRSPAEYIGDWLEPRHLAEHGIREIPTSPVRGPELREVRGHLPKIDEMLSRASRGRAEAAHVLEIKGIDRRERVFKEATALLYRAEGGTDCQVAFVVDGVHSEAHENAFAAKGLQRKLGIGKEGLPATLAVARSELPPETLAQLDEEEANARLSELHRAEQSAESPDDEAIAVAKARLDELPCRTLGTYEHPRLLRSALEGAQSRLLVISPWIRPGVVNRQFQLELERCLERGVRVHIGWGISKDESDEPDAHPASLSLLEQLASRFPKLTLERLGGTHSKILVCDDDTYVATSFNWLSFKGDPKRTFRDERGVLVVDPDFVNTEYGKLVRLFSESD